MAESPGPGRRPVLRLLDLAGPFLALAVVIGGGYGTGGKVWSSAAVLTRWLGANAAALGLEGASVLGLGSGTGAVGLLACIKTLRDGVIAPIALR